MISVASLVKPVIVRVSTSAARGTGFFVSPNVVLSCAHVTRSEADAPVTIHWQGRILRGRLVKQYPARIDGDGAAPYPDLALVQLLDVDNPCALLDPLPPAIDGRLHSRGFTTTWSPIPMEEPCTFTYEGLHDVEGGALLKLSSGEAVPGMSGAPLIDLTRGVVCGILKTSRAIESDRGGWGIPVTAISEFFPEVMEANKAYHSAADVWSSVARRLMASEPEGLILDIGSVTETSSSGKPAVVLFTITNSSPERVKIPAITLRQIKATRLVEPHHFRPEGLPEHYELEVHLTPGKTQYELIELHHVLEPAETEGYRLKITAEEGWRYQLALSVTWRQLGKSANTFSTSEPFNIAFKIMSTAGLLDIVRTSRAESK